MGATARAGAPLSSQPTFLSSLKRIERVARLMADAREVRPGFLALASRDEVLHLDAIPWASNTDLAMLGDERPHHDTTEDPILHPSLSELVHHPVLARVLRRISAAEVLERAAPRVDWKERETQRALHAWLIERERDIVTDAAARHALREGSFFLTDRNTLKPSSQLMWEDQMPRLGIDWTPHPDIPQSVRALMERVLDSGDTLEFVRLLTDHLAPAYHERAQRKDRKGARRILSYVTHKLEDVPDRDRRAWLHSTRQDDTPWLVEDASGAFTPAPELVWPSSDARELVLSLFGTSAPTPHPDHHSVSSRGVLLSMGVRAEVDAREIDAAMELDIGDLSRSVRIAQLLKVVARVDRAAVTKHAKLRERAWVIDRSGRAKAPSACFIERHDTTRLLGPIPEHFAHATITDALGEDLAVDIGFKTAREITLPHIARGIEHRARLGRAIPILVYTWLE
ncbi:MAG: hypothetical protein AAGI01_18925, partial [Myxococcota bacterium]